MKPCCIFSLRNKSSPAAFVVIIVIALISSVREKASVCDRVAPVALAIVLLVFLTEDDFKNHKKSAELERPVIRLIRLTRKLSCNEIELKRCSTTDKRRNKKEPSRSSHITSQSVCQDRRPVHINRLVKQTLCLCCYWVEGVLVRQVRILCHFTCR